MIVIIHLQRGIPSKRKSLACIDYVPALCTHRPSLLPIGWFSEVHGLLPLVGSPSFGILEVTQTWSSRGSKSRNKVSVGEPAEGSLTRIHVKSPRILRVRLFEKRLTPKTLIGWKLCSILDLAVELGISDRLLCLTPLKIKSSEAILIGEFEPPFFLN